MTVATAVAFFLLRKMNLLTGFLRGKWLLGVLTGLFTVSFIVCAIAMLREAEWAVPALTYTIYLWLAYIWLNSLKKIWNLVVLLRWDKAKSISQFMGRSAFFDQLLEKTVELSARSAHPEAEEPGEAHAVTDSAWEDLINDEEWFKEVFPGAVRQKIRRSVTGLLVLTAIFVLILVLVN